MINLQDKELNTFLSQVLDLNPEQLKIYKSIIHDKQNIHFDLNIKILNRLTEIKLLNQLIVTFKTINGVEHTPIIEELETLISIRKTEINKIEEYFKEVEDGN